MAHQTRHRRTLAFSDPPPLPAPPLMNPSDDKPSKHRRAPPPSHPLPDPTSTPPSTVVAISHRFSKLYANHKKQQLSGSSDSAVSAALTKSGSHREQNGKTTKKFVKEDDCAKDHQSWTLDTRKGLESSERRLSVQPVPPAAGRRRRSFCNIELELADFLSCSGAKVVAADMPPLMQIHAVDCARNARDSLEKFTSKTLAFTLKKEFDGAYGPAWHCIVGTSFGSFVTHSVGGFMYFSLDHKLYVLLFKTAVQKAQ